MNCYSILKTAKLGDLLLVADETHLTGIYFNDCEHVPPMGKGWKLNPRHSVLQRAAAEIQEYLKGNRKSFSIPLRFAGTSFQQSIWTQIAKIPFGETITYTELAKRAGAPTALRAAGTATGRNPLGIVIPCHRVVGKNGGLGGYAGGLDRKKRLLEVESIDLALT
jgi:methylated-DNA-[protein]-cysteine S-methyltransferase